MKLNKLYLGLVALILIGGGAGFYYHTHSAAPAYHCLAGPNEQCATEEWYSELQDLQALNKKYSPPADVQKQMKEKLALLQSTVPAGYDWNDQKKVFVKRAAPPSLTQPVPSQPAK
jgi:hypothetical protein